MLILHRRVSCISVYVCMCVPAVSQKLSASCVSGMRVIVVQRLLFCLLSAAGLYVAVSRFCLYSVCDMIVLLCIVCIEYMYSTYIDTYICYYSNFTRVTQAVFINFLNIFCS